MSLDFARMNLPLSVHKALRQMNFEKPTPIQAAAIPLVRAGRDLIGCAQTGTGKTAAFCIPLVSRLIENPLAAALILAPTRELALQIADVLKELTSASPQLHTVLLIGGVDMQRQLRDLKKQPSVIVATPGRLTDHLRRRSVNLSQVEMLVLDEGDRMLDMGFEPQINAILKFMKVQRQTLLFSATMPEKIKKLAQRYLKNPEFISVGQEAKPAERMNHSVIQTSQSQKHDVLLDQLNARSGSVLIFVNTKHGTNRLTTFLEEYGYAVTRIHGDRSQGQRNQALQGFRSGQFRILVATDVAARGLDVPHIAHVINFDLPRDLDDYVHRIGRTARAGAQGEALCLLANEDRTHWNRIARTLNLEMVAGGNPDKSAQRENGRSPRRENGKKSNKPAWMQKRQSHRGDRYKSRQNELQKNH